MRSKFTATGPIPVSEILIDQNNYRFDIRPDNPVDCIALMLADVDNVKKMIKIASHIAQNGISPKPIVVSKDNRGRWVVRDGNRRVAALKLLNNPAEATDKHRQPFQKIRESAVMGMIPNAIECLTADNATILEYMKLEHMGPQDGIGQVDWGPREKGNLQADTDGTPQYALARAICSYLEEHGVAEARNVSISNIQRLMQDAEISERLGFVWNGKQIEFHAIEEQVFNILKEIVLDFAIRGKKVSAIYDSGLRMDYINKLFGERGLKEPTPVERPVFPTSKEKTAESSTGGGIRARTKAPSERKRVIERYKGLPIPPSETKLNALCAELRSKINVKEAPIAAGILIRLILELSLNSYAERHSIPYYKDDEKLHKRISKVADKMNELGAIDKKKLDLLNKMNNSSQFISANTLNAWVHDSTSIPEPREVCIFWDNIYFFLVECWK